MTSMTGLALLNNPQISSLHFKYIHLFAKLIRHLTDSEFKPLLLNSLKLGHPIYTGVLKVTLPNYLVVIITRCQMCIEHAGQQFEQFM
jgi:hypothetical protein